MNHNRYPRSVAHYLNDVALCRSKDIIIDRDAFAKPVKLTFLDSAVHKCDVCLIDMLARMHQVVSERAIGGE